MSQPVPPAFHGSGGGVAAASPGPPCNSFGSDGNLRGPVNFRGAGTSRGGSGVSFYAAAPTGSDSCEPCGLGCGPDGVMSYVGDGQGEFVQQQTYKYSGQGGDFNMVRTQRDYTCLATVAGILLCSLLLLPVVFWRLSSGGGDSLLHDCHEGLATWKTSWSKEKQEFCCIVSERGCASLAESPKTVPETTPAFNQPPPLPPMQVTQPMQVTKPPPPAAVRVSAARAPAPQPQPQPPAPAQPPSTQRPIMARPQPPPLPQQMPPPTQQVAVQPSQYDCLTGFEDWAFLWSSEQKSWCCQAQGKGCSAQVPTSELGSEMFDCTAGFSNWMAGWSVNKKAWCCQHEGKGCAPTAQGCSTSSPFDCEDGYSNWLAGWSIAKKAWCCTNTGKGCLPGLVEST